MRWENERHPAMGKDEGEICGMTLLGEMLVADGMRKGMQKGLQEGKQEGRIEGREEGGQIKLISMVRKKMLRGYDPAQIAEVLEEEPAKVEKICRILKAEGMEVSDEEIYRKCCEDDSANE